MPPAIIVQRFCIMLQAILSSQVQVIFMPPVHFSILNVQRGTIIQFMDGGMLPGMAVRRHALGAHARHARIPSVPSSERCLPCETPFSKVP